MDESKAPKLLETFSEAVKLGLDSRGLRTLVPWFFLLAIGGPVITGHYWHSEIQDLLRIPGVLTILSATMVIGGLLSGVCINIMREIYTISGDKEFGAFLKRLDLLDQYIFWPQYVLLLQLGLVAYCLLVIAAIVMFPKYEIVPYLFAMTFGLLIYVVTKTYGLVDMVRVLVWHRQRFRDESAGPS